jgi:hypothetical protein
MAAAIAIRNADAKRLFDVQVDETTGKILDYEVKNEKGKFKISGEEVDKQINENLKKKKKK